ncbi:MAG: oxidoreductase [Myxococcales bacterium]|nr:oxidoreductase [Myxococcales bacterium]
MHYNVYVLKARVVSSGPVRGHLLLALFAAPLLMGGACEKKSAKAGDTGAITALDRAGSGAAPTGPVDKTPLPGIEIDKLGSDKQELFYSLVGSLSSPCGKAHSLRTSFTSDTACKRAPFAVRYLKSLLEEEIPEAEVREFYEKKYKPTGDAPVKLDASKAPHEGADDAQVRLYEFYDYGCPHCKLFKAMMDQVLADEQGKVVEYFMQFPLEKHVDSKSAAQAAIAAGQQGKFKQMHAMLFDKTPLHDHEHVSEYAKAIGVDMTKFEADYTAALPHVESDLKQGEAAGVDSTPTLFFNDRKYDGPMSPKYIEMWIDEEVAVNR